MKNINDLAEISQGNILLTIGNFDGVHLGHQKLLMECYNICKEKDYVFVLATFSPHPRKILGVFKSHFQILSNKLKKSSISKLGVDFYWEINFNRDLSNLKPDEFIEQYILKNKNLKILFLGHDFSFGSNKSGGFDYIKQYCEKKNLNVHQGQAYKIDGQTISSTLVRQEIVSGKIKEANKLLGRSFSLSGTVVRGAGRGKVLGFPTANIYIENDQLIPSGGVYVTRTNYKGMSYQSMTNIGFNPTFNTEKSLNVETNIFDFGLDIYGEEIEIQFEVKVRDEIKFSSVNELIEQIGKDKVFAKKFFENEKN